MAADHQDTWQHENDAYWMKRLSEEVVELADSLAGIHPDPPEHEMLQIAAICINWMRKRSIVGLEVEGESSGSFRV